MTSPAAAPAGRYEIELRCPWCGQLRVHVVRPAAGGLSRVTCIACGRAEAVRTLQFMERYADTVARRLLVKPFEIATELRRSPRDFVARLPGRMLSKPFRVAAELRTTADIIRPRRSGRPAGAARPAPAAAPTPAAPESYPPMARRCRVLLSAPLLWAHSSLEILEVAHRLGYDGVELWAYQLDHEGGEVGAVAARARELGSHLTLHMLSWDLNPASQIEAIRAASLAALHHCVELGVRLGVSLVVMHPGRVTVPHDEGGVYWPRLVAAVQEIADHAAHHGMTVGVEHMEARQAEFIVTAQEANRLLGDVDRPNVGTVLDVAHIPWGEDEVAFLGQLRRVVHVHLSDADESRLHLPLGQGGRDLVRIMRALRDYAGTVAIEGFSISAGEELARWNKAEFEELWRVAAPEVPAT
jgi:sugar phosphate isomerase/epimerase